MVTIFKFLIRIFKYFISNASRKQKVMIPLKCGITNPYKPYFIFGVCRCHTERLTFLDLILQDVILCYTIDFFIITHIKWGLKLFHLTFWYMSFYLGQNVFKIVSCHLIIKINNTTMRSSRIYLNVTESFFVTNNNNNNFNYHNV